jgi:protein-tyrosine-phosphatase
LIFLDRRENTFCMPMHCGSSMLSGFTATAMLAYFFNQTSPSTAQLISAGFMVIALGFLSPLHHFDRVLAKLRKTLTMQPGLNPRQKFPARDSDEVYIEKAPYLVLFVCSGNTCRSPMAATIGKAEIATRLGIPFESIDKAHAKVMSAGVSARAGEPMTAEAKEALRQLGFHPNGHRARNMTVELVDQAEKIFCMTNTHREAVLALVPSVTGKTQCLDPNGDIDDPIGRGIESHVQCARTIHSLVRMRFDEICLTGDQQG